MTTRSLDNHGETEALAGAEASPSGPPSGRSAKVIPFRPRIAAASLWSDEEADDCWEQVGLPAIRIVGNFDYPRIHVEKCAPEDGEEEHPPGL